MGLEAKNKIRNSNIELTRIICMFFIFSGHFIGQSGSIEITASINDYILILMSHFSRIAVNIFLLIGIWFMVDKKFSASRVLNLYFQLAVYCIPITIAVTILHFGELSTKDILRGLFPFFGRALWFASAYMTLMLFKPFLDKIIEWNQKSLQSFICLLFVSISFISTLPDKQEGYVIDTVWFTVVYIFVAYLKKYNKENKKVPYTYLGIAAIVAYIALASFVFLNKVIKDNSILQIINKFAVQYLDDIKTIPNFLIALFITLWVLNSKLHHNSIINNISKPVFSIYIIHQVPVLIPFLWIKVFKSDRWITNHYFWYVIVSYIIFYLLCSFIDMIRRKFLEPIIVKTKAYEKALVLIKRLSCFDND